MTNFNKLIDEAEAMHFALKEAAEKEQYCYETKLILERFSFEMLVLKNNLTAITDWEVSYV